MTFGKLLRLMLCCAALNHANLAFAGQILASFDYADLQANVNYTTNPVRVYGAPLHVDAVEIKVFGSNCHIVSKALLFSRVLGGPALAASPDGNGGFVVNDTIDVLEYRFEQRRWNFVDCRLEVWSTGDTSDLGDIRQLAGDLFRSAVLLNISVMQNDDYQSLRDEAQSLRDYVSYFNDTAQTSQSLTQLKTLFDHVKNATEVFEAAFIPLHVTIRDRGLEDAWRLYSEDYLAIQF